MKGNLSDYSLERIAEIRETLAVLLNCTSKEILIGGACPSNSFLLVLSIKETYSCKLLALEQCDKDKLTKLNIDYIIVDLIVISLEPSKGAQFIIYNVYVLCNISELIVNHLHPTCPLLYYKRQFHHFPVLICKVVYEQCRIFTYITF